MLTLGRPSVGLSSRICFWATTLSNVDANFQNKIEDFKQVNPNAYDHLLSRHPQTWCRAFFKRGVVCEAIKMSLQSALIQSS